MKVVLEFGIRGGAHGGCAVLPSIKLGKRLAVSLVHVLSNGDEPGNRDFRAVNRTNPRVTWSSSTHFVALSVLDGVDRGPASSVLWRKPCLPGNQTGTNGAEITTQDEDAIREWLNVVTALVDGDGDVWVEGPCTGHWLSTEQKAAYVIWRSKRL